MAATATRAALAVTPEVEETAAWLAEFAQRATRPPTSEPAAIADLREEAIERFRELGFPTTRQEAWRATNVAAIARGEFRSPAAPARGEEREDDLQAAQPWIFPAAATLTFLDGHLISAEQPLQAGLVAMSLAQALAERPDEVAAHLGRHASFENHSFVALNTALWQDGAYVRLAPGTVVREPIHLLFLSTGKPVDGAAPVTFPRNLLVIGESAQATVVETYAALDGPETPETKGRYFTCAVTELVAGPNSAVDHYKVQRESLGAFHLATFEVWQDRSSTLSSHSIALGGALVRNDVNATLDGEGIDTHLNGLYVVGGTQFVDNHMRVEHAKPHCASHELYKGVLEGKARAVFNGLIHVRHGAQKTDAKQSNRNLLLSPEAIANSNPQLEIFADDVRCTHGSTVGQLDEDAIFYLRSRGIGAEAAKSLLTYAFASDIVERVKVEPVRRDLEEFLFRRLPGGETVRQAV
ncbi:MAG TPA: Fe-S cluster assembly protein SufD [Thermoanaerobaculia bacterium]|nr:Fe-S cluster assembly protein SufD [Thermoanaerobaculia bacterium]